MKSDAEIHPQISNSDLDKKTLYPVFIEFKFELMIVKCVFHFK